LPFTDSGLPEDNRSRSHLPDYGLNNFLKPCPWRDLLDVNPRVDSPWSKLMTEPLNSVLVL
jgi:hypothetical protein